ncbi:hypothetical protein UPYG_G00136400, partial [Umbra pygmaea]
ASWRKRRELLPVQMSIEGNHSRARGGPPKRENCCTLTTYRATEIGHSKEKDNRSDWRNLSELIRQGAETTAKTQE